MAQVTRILRTYWRPAAITFCLLGMLWPIVQQGLFWADVDPFRDYWILRRYFLDPFLAALVFGLIVARWGAVSVAGIGTVASLVVTWGVTETKGEDFSPSYASAWSLYLETALGWLWIAGLIALGITLSHQLGGLRIPQGGDRHPPR
jgi:hypothetical protein